MFSTSSSTNDQLTKTNAELAATVAKLNAQIHQLQRQSNVANNRFVQHGILRPRVNNTHRQKANDIKNTTHKFNDNKSNERTPTYKFE